MLKARKWLYAGLVLLGMGVAFLLLPPYATYCESTYQNDKYGCASYEILSSILSFLEAHNALITAIATGFIALFTFTLRRSTDNLWDASRQQLDHARIAFLSSLRPRMRVKHIWFTGELGDIWKGAPIEVRIDAVNSGEGRALVTKFNYMTWVVSKDRGLPQRPPYNEDPEPAIYSFPSRTPLDSGVTITSYFSDGCVLSPQDISNIRNGSARLYVIGTIEYRDVEVLGVMRDRLKQTAFCRYLTFENYPPHAEDMGRFKKDEHPDYEYQD
jgi:hypothetical protein